MNRPAHPAEVLAVLEAIAERELGRAPPLLPQQSLTEEVAPDSLARLQLVMAIENTFEICLADEEAMALERVSDAVGLIAHKLANKPSAAARP